MPTSLEKQITDGAQIFLGAHASYFIDKRVPDRIMDRTSGFQIQDMRQRQGCWIAEYDVIFAGVAGAYLWDLGKDLAKDYLKKTFQQLIHSSYEAWTHRCPIVGTPFERIEPVLELPAQQNVPVFDFDAEDEFQRRRLYNRVDESFSKMTAPIGRAASHVELWFDERRLGAHKRRVFTDSEITEAVLSLKQDTRRLV